MGLKLENNLGTKFNLSHANNASEISLTSKVLTSTAYTVEIIDELIDVPVEFNTVIVKDINRGGTFVSKTEIDIDPNVDTGDYNITFTTGVMENSNWCLAANGIANASAHPMFITLRSASNSSSRIVTYNETTSTYLDPQSIRVAFFGGLN